MCGIIAVAGRYELTENKNLALRVLSHRGPDAEGHWSSADNSVWLGHRRLSIVDLSPAGRQPMHNENKTLWLVCNGEIYNYLNLRRRLEGLGHQFYSNSDSEVILHAYEAWGENCVDYLQGMFAFVLWDETKRMLLAARDPIGIKPLYYATRNDYLILASELGPVIKLLSRDVQPDPLAVAYIMTLGYVPSPLAIWAGTKKLEAGYILTWKPGQQLQTRMYWEPPRTLNGDQPPTIETLQSHFTPVLQEHLLSDVPIGLFLSGGLDSSAIALGLRDLNQPLQTLTVGFSDSEYSEASTARITASHLNLPHKVLSLSVGDIDALLPRVAAAFDEPQGYSALLPIFLLSEITASRFKVALAGDGGDELFGGYNWYQNLNRSISRTAPYLYKILRNFVKYSGSSQMQRRSARTFAQTSVLHRHAWRVFPRFLPEEAEMLLAPAGLRFTDEEMLEPLRRHFEPGLPLRNALQRVDLMTFCTDSILAKVDKASMAHSLEVRVPWLDRRMVEWALSSPDPPKSNVESKTLLRDYLRSKIPEEVLQHPKQGFSWKGILQYDWDSALDKINQGPWVQSGFWNKDWERLIVPGAPAREHRIWILLFITEWAKRWWH